MPVREIAQLDRTDAAATGSPGKKLNYNARRLAAEMARVAVPQLRSDGRDTDRHGLEANHRPRTGFEARDSNALASMGPSVLPQPQPTAHGSEAGGDMFDTDLEGIDDTVTVTGSMVNEHQAVERRPKSRATAGKPPLRQYETFAERLAKAQEQQQELEREEQQEQPMQQQPSALQGFMGASNGDHDAVSPRASGMDAFANDSNNRGEYDDPEVDHLLEWEDTMELDKHPRTWQEIEAALRQGSNGFSRDVERGAAEPVHRSNAMPAPAPLRRRTNSGHNRSRFMGAPRPSTTEAALRPPVPRARIANSRFAALNPLATTVAPAAATGSASLGGGFRDLPPKRPASVPGQPLSPPLSSEKENIDHGAYPGGSANLRHPMMETDRLMARMRDANADADMHMDLDMEPVHAPDDRHGGIFDTTALSAVNSSDSSDRHSTYTSLRLSTASPVASVTSKRGVAAYEADYPPNILRSKTFAELDAESFDYNPAPMQPIFPPQPQGPPLSLYEKLDRLRSLTEDQRRDFFSSLTMAEWEDSGDWLIEQFGELLQRTKAARRERRKVAQMFEEEIARRYALLEQESSSIKHRMNEMRSGGLDVLRGQRQK
ncbi:hypothetical protein KEM52_002344 [Ascosphaera acerosa]|nr:hypothetical protein KEM52_002344 [Ascosphaera acerosa]